MTQMQSSALRGSGTEDEQMHRLVNQLTIYKEANWETLYFLNQLGCSSRVTRTAVLFVNEKNNPDDGFPEACEEILKEEMLSGEDLYGSISEQRFLIFLAAEPDPDAPLPKRLECFIRSFLERLNRFRNFHVRAFTGSTYAAFSELYQSFEEAHYLSVCHTIDPKEVFVPFYKYAGDYLMHHFCAQYPNHILSELAENYRNLRLDTGLLTNLVHSDFNLTDCAVRQGIHRNTLNSRMERMENELLPEGVKSTAGRDKLHALAIRFETAVVWNVSVNIQPRSMLHLGFLHLAELLREYSNDSFQLDIRFVPSTGDFFPLLDALNKGGVDCIAVHPSTLSLMLENCPEILEMPFLFDDEKEAAYLLNHSIRNIYEQLFSNSNTHLLDFWSMGWRKLTANKELRTPQDLFQTRIRSLHTSDRAYALYQSAGASLMHIHYVDMQDALRNGLVDVEDNPCRNILDMEFYKYHSYLLDLNMYYDINALFCSETALDKLSDLQRAALARALRETAAWLLLRTHEQNQAAEQELLQQGMILVTPSDEELSMWKDWADSVFLHGTQQGSNEVILRERREYRAGKENY